jgi:hypothetical protein
MAVLALAGVAALGTGVQAVRANHARAATRAAQAATLAALEHQPAPTPPVEAPAAAPSAPEQPAPEAPVAATTTTGEVEIADAKALRDQALKLLEKSKNAEAMIAATKSLDADPTDAMPYLVLGSALQDAGRWNEAAHAYKLCLKNAKKGMVEECRAMVRRR